MPDIFNEDELAADQVVSDEANQETETQAEQRLRDEQGRFAAKDDGPGRPAEESAETQEAGKTKQVPQGALHAEREKRKGAEAERDAERARAAELETNWTKAKEQLDALAAMRAQIAAVKAPEPAVVAKPEGDASELEYLKARLAQIEGGVAEVQGYQHQTAQQQQLAQVEEAEIAQLQHVTAQAETEYRATNPDYDNGIKFVVEARAKELQLYGIPQSQINEIIRDESRDIIRAAIQQGRNPAELGYQIALSRGYRPEAQQQQQGGGAAATVAAVAAAKAGARSLGQASGSGPAQELNAQTIAAMDTAEFEALYSTPEGRRMIDAL